MLKTNYGYILIFLAALALGALSYFHDLGQRPFHGDEANQAVRTGILLEKGEYRYDPHEHHGPTLYYLALVPLHLMGVERIEDAGEAIFRLVPAVFGLLTILLLLPLRRAMGWPAITVAAVLTAASPAVTYYSRYFIQEMLLVAFAMAAIVCGWLYVERKTALLAFLTGTMLGAMYATKETCILLFAAMGIATALTWLWSWRNGSQRPALPAWPHALLGSAGAFLVSFLFYSSFFSNPAGFLNSFLAYEHYIGRAQGGGSAGQHDKPWYYYLLLLAYTSRGVGPRWSEAFILLLAVIAIAAALLRKSPPGAASAFLHFRVFYTLTLTGLFSLIPYKTPWNLLPFFHGVILLAGTGAAVLLTRGRSKVWHTIVILLLIAGTAHLAWQSHLANGRYAADVSNPYAYAHPSTNLLRLVERIEELSAHAPAGKNLHINIIKPDADYWPLPWYLRSYCRVGYWTQLPPDPDAAIIIAEPDVAKVVYPKLEESYTSSMYSLRPNVLLLMFVRQDLWDAFMADRQ